VTVVSWPAQRALAIDLAERAGAATEWPGLGTRRPGQMQLIVVPSGRYLDSLSSGRAPGWSAAIALPSTRTILLRADRDDLYGTLRHELAHLALHQAVAVRVPLWFDEGYASWAAGEWDRSGLLDLNLAVVRGAIPDLETLDGALRGSASTADAAYALAMSAVTELAARNPEHSIAPLMKRLETGDDFETAVRVTTGLTIGQFEREWRQVVRRRYSLVTWMLAGGGWGLIAVTFWALSRLRKRGDRARRAALDQGWEIDPEIAAASELDRTPEP
jgi:peptidase MA superfamily protein